MHSIEFDLSPYGSPQISLAATLITFFLGIAAARWMIAIAVRAG